jgi:hypothetical protein
MLNWGGGWCDWIGVSNMAIYLQRLRILQKQEGCLKFTQFEGYTSQSGGPG